jgi:hypothetical protein
MRGAELAVLVVLISALSIMVLGIGLYLKKFMTSHNIDWELQLAAIGFLILLYSLTTAKILSRVE